MASVCVEEWEWSWTVVAVVSQTRGTNRVTERTGMNVGFAASSTTFVPSAVDARMLLLSPHPLGRVTLLS